MRQSASAAVRKPSTRSNLALTRYDGGSAYTPAQGLAKPPPSLNVRTAVAAVPDPYDPTVRIRATVNRRVDLLEQERSHKRLSEDEYQVGRIVQAVFERASGASRSAWSGGNRVDMAIAHELAIIHAIEDAETINGYVERIVRAIGEAGARRLRRHLMGQGFGEEAEARGQTSRSAVAFVAERFRDDLRSLSDAWAARGRMILVEERGERVPQIRSFRAEATGEEVDSRGIVVPIGRGHLWGQEDEAAEA